MQQFFKTAQYKTYKAFKYFNIKCSISKRKSFLKYSNMSTQDIYLNGPDLNKTLFKYIFIKK